MTCHVRSQDPQNALEGSDGQSNLSADIYRAVKAAQNKEKTQINRRKSFSPVCKAQDCNLVKQLPGIHGQSALENTQKLNTRQALQTGTNPCCQRF
jgi:hypothetical protein